MAESYARTSVVLGDPGNAATLDALQALQGQDGGVAPAAGYKGAALDTAWAARALLSRNFASDLAIGWLGLQQQADGSWTAAPRSPVFVSATVLRALRDAAARNPAAATAAARGSAYLLGQRKADGSWGEPVWLTALAYEAVHDFLTDTTVSAAVHDWLAARQSADGSWNQDPFATAIALRALALTSAAPRNPTLAGLTLKVVDSETAAPLAGVTLSLSGASTQTATSDGGGVITLSGVTAGAYSGSLSLASYASVVVNVSLISDQLTDLGILQISRSTGGASATTATVSGTIVDNASRAPLANVAVALSGSSLQATTDAQGKYIITSVPPAAYTVTASKTGYLSAAGSLTALAGKEYVFSPTLTVATGGTDGSTCRLFGTITRASDGAAVGSASVSVAGANTSSTSSDASGAFLLAGLQSGTTTITASAAGYDSVSSTYTLACNTGAAFNYSPRLYGTGTTTPGANTASVSFTLVSASTGAALPGVTVTATPLGKAARTLVTDSAGHFTVDKLQEASVQIDVTTTGYDALSLSYQVEPLQAKDLGELRLRPSGTDPLLPDLKVLKVQRGTAVTDPQTLQVSGSISVDVQNVGRAPQPQAVQVVAFVDVDRDGRYDPAIDKTLGQITLEQLLSVNQTATLSVPVAGTLPFRDAPIHVLLDSNQQVAEINEANNVKSTADAAEILPAIGTFVPVLKWQWTGATSAYPDYNQVMMAPVAGRLLDTNGDGKIDALDAPVVAFMSFYKGGYYISDGVLRVVHGVTGAELLTIRDAQYPLSTDCSLALADLDGDGRPEIIAITKDYRIIVYRNDGTRWWVSAPVEANNGSSPWGGVYVADLDGDGHPEIVWGRAVYSFDGMLKWRASGTYFGTSLPGYQTFSLPIAADLFRQGQQNVIIGASAYSASGQLLWAAQDGFSAVGDFNGDGMPEIAVVYNGTVALYTNTGQLKWRVSIPGGGSGGPPTIADVDGDGIPEIGVAGGNAYTVFRKDGSVLWSKASQDNSSQVTGSTVFDFDGDGASEVLYGDEISLKAFRGASGQLLWSIPNSSGTTLEYPVVVDLDGDGHADLITIANDYAYQPNQTVHLHGIRVFQDQNNSWVNVRPLWNQHAYNISNVNDDLTIPAKPQLSWTVHNTYRANKRLDVSPTAVADPTASYLRVLDNGGSQASTVTVRVGNGGALGTPTGLKVAFYAGAAGGSVIGVGATTRALAAGEYEDVTLSVNGSLSAYTSLTVVVDDNGTGKHAITDFDRSNNSVQGDLTQLATSLGVSVVTYKPVYTELDLPNFTATVVNTGSFAKSALVRFTVLAADGSTVEVLPVGAAVGVPAGGAAPAMATGSASAALTGDYQVVAELVTSTGLVYGSAKANFRIVSSNASSVGAGLMLDKARYSAGDLIQVRSRVFNATANALVENLTATTTVFDAAGHDVWHHAEAIDQLAPQGLREFGYSINAGTLAPGAYTAQLIVTDNLGGQRAGSAASFMVLGSDFSGIGLRGSLTVPTVPVAVGDVAAITAAAFNAGNTALNDLPLKVRIVSPDTAQLLAEFPYTTSLAVGGAYSASANWTASGPAGSVVAVLVAVVGGKEVVLAQAVFTTTPEERVQIQTSGAVKAEARVLVLLSCPPGTSTDAEPGCLAARGAAVDASLNALGVMHKVVTTKDDFQSEMHCGLYNTYWISGGSTKLDDQLVKELREAVRRGEGLLLDGVHDSRNQLLHPAAGVHQRGKLPQSGYVATIPGGGLFAAGTRATLGEVTKFDLTTGQAQASFDGGVPAIVSNQYGQGHATLFAFDLAAMLEQPGAGADTSLSQILGRTLDYLSSGGTSLTVGDVAVLQTTVTNLGTRAVTIEWRATLPAGTQLVNASMVPTLLTPPSGSAEGLAVWSATIAAGMTADVTLRLQVNQATSDLAVPVALYSVASSGGPAVLRDTVTHHLSVADGATLAQSAVSAINKVAPSRASDANARNRAVSDAAQAQSLMQQGDPAGALSAWVAAADELGSISSGDMSVLASAQLAVAWAVEAATDQLCASLRCLAASVAMSSTTPMPGTTVSLTRHAQNTCPVAMSNVTLSLVLQNRRTSTSLTLASDTLSLGSAAASDKTTTWTADGQAGDVIDWAVRGSWIGQTWTINTDSFQLSAQ